MEQNEQEGEKKEAGSVSLLIRVVRQVHAESLPPFLPGQLGVPTRARELY